MFLSYLRACVCVCACVCVFWCEIENVSMRIPAHFFLTSNSIDAKSTTKDGIIDHGIINTFLPTVTLCIEYKHWLCLSVVVLYWFLIDVTLTYTTVTRTLCFRDMVIHKVRGRRIIDDNEDTGRASAGRHHSKNKNHSNRQQEQEQEQEQYPQQRPRTTTTHLLIGIAIVWGSGLAFIFLIPLLGSFFSRCFTSLLMLVGISLS